MASRKELLDSLKPGMHLDKNFFLKVYGYEITRPGFADDVIKRLEFLGCSKAREYYTCTVAEFEYKRAQEFKEVARWYAKQNDVTKNEIDSCIRSVISENQTLQYDHHPLQNL